MPKKMYSIQENGATVLSPRPGTYAGHKEYKVFGTLSCTSGMRMNPENRVFFHSIEDAVAQGYRPCNHCRPMDADDWKDVKHLVHDCRTLHDFYQKNVRH